MKKFLLDYNLKVRLPLILFVAIMAFAVTYYVSYAERNGIGYAPEQPIAFSHSLHAGTMQINCKYCHIGVDKSRIASVPSTDICMNCHSIARKDKPEIMKLTKFYEDNKPIPWKRVHKVPDFVYFSHAVHVNKGIGCSNCHGDITKMDVVGQVNSFTMGSCLDCHRNPDKKIKNFSDLPDLKKGPEYCVACHR
jgi:hypothetical protein